MSASSANSLDPALVKRVLDRLEIPIDAQATPETLRALYASWCHRVPFDNVQKLISMRWQEESTTLPGTTATGYFHDWLRHGTGGTCWAGAGALHALLCAIGFHAERALGTMLVAPDLPPNHGSVRVRIAGDYFLLDTSVLHQEPLLLQESWATQVEHPAWGVRCSQREGRWHVNWRPLHKPDGFECRFESFGTGLDEYRQRYEQTRGWSPFNYQVFARRNRGDEVLGLAFGNFIRLKSEGSVEITHVDDAERRRILIGEFGMSEEIVSQLPADRPTPPPPGSQTAAAAES